MGDEVGFGIRPSPNIGFRKTTIEGGAQDFCAHKSCIFRTVSFGHGFVDFVRSLMCSAAVERRCLQEASVKEGVISRRFGRFFATVAARFSWKYCVLGKRSRDAADLLSVAKSRRMEARSVQKAAPSVKVDLWRLRSSLSLTILLSDAVVNWTAALPDCHSALQRLQSLG